MQKIDCKKLWLLIDDERDLLVDAIARNHVTAKALLELKCWASVCWDHDLHCCDDDGNEVTGYHIMLWAAENKCLPLHVQLVTANPAGRANMSALLIVEGYINPSGDGINFYHPTHPMFR